MKVTILFKNPKANSHEGQSFDVTAWEIHSAYKFLGMNLTSGAEMQFNMDDIFSFMVEGQ